MSDEYQLARQNTFAALSDLLPTLMPSAQHIYMQYNETRTSFINNLCQESAHKMLDELISCFDDLAAGGRASSYINRLAIKHHVAHIFPENEIGGQASALYDAALLLTTIDPEPFCTHVDGPLKNDAIQHMNKALYLMVSEISDRWNATARKAKEKKPRLIDAELPKEDSEPASPANLFKIIAYSFGFYSGMKTPYHSEAAQKFSELFPSKHWPLRADHDVDDQLFQDQCPLYKLSCDLQDWYFGVGQTQLETDDIKARRSQENSFFALREEMNRRARECNQACSGNACVSHNIDEIMKDVPDSSFKQACSFAVRTLNKK